MSPGGRQCRARDRGPQLAAAPGNWPERIIGRRPSVWSVAQATAARLTHVRLGMGALHLLFPGFGARLLTGRPFGRRARAVVRTLGARQLIQALVTVREPTADVLGLGAAVDTAHAATMVLLGVFDRGDRRAAFANAVIAAALAVIGVLASRASCPSARATGLLGIRDRWAERLANHLLPDHLYGSHRGGGSSCGSEMPTRG